MIRPKPMRSLSATLFLALFTAAFAADAAPLPAPHQVDIASANLTLHAQLYKPDGDGPFPTVIGTGWVTFVPPSPKAMSFPPPV